MKESTPKSEQGSARPPTDADRAPGWSMVAGLVVTAIFVLFLVHDASPLDVPPILGALALTLLFLTATPALLLIRLGATLLHELGHVAFVVAFGMTLASIRVGPWTVSKSAGTWRLRFDAKASPSTGQTVFLRRDISRRRLWWIYAAGPLANLVTAAAVMVFGWTVGPRPLRAALFSIAIVSTIAGVGNLIPAELPSCQHTDGARMLALADADGSLCASVKAGRELFDTGRPGWRPSSRAARELFDYGLTGRPLSSAAVSAANAHSALTEERTSGGRLLLLVRMLGGSEPWLARLPLERSLLELADRPALLRVTRLHAAAYFSFVEPDPGRVRGLVGRLAAGSLDRFSAALSNVLGAIAEGRDRLVDLAVLRQAFIDSDRARSPLYGYAWILERLWQDRELGPSSLVPPPPLPAGRA